MLYIIGHGLKGADGRLYLAMTDTRRDSLPFTSLAAERIQYAVDGSLSGQKVLILDSAYGNAHARGRFAKAGGEAHALEPFQGRGCTVLTASDVIQYSFMDDKLQGDTVRLGFTRHLIAGLRDGSADLDGDGEITIDELYGYVHDRVVAERPRHRPKRQGNVEGRTIIARNIKRLHAEMTEAPEDTAPVIEAVPQRPRRFRMPERNRHTTVRQHQQRQCGITDASNAKRTSDWRVIPDVLQADRRCLGI